MISMIITTTIIVSVLTVIMLTLKGGGGYGCLYNCAEPTLVQKKLELSLTNPRKYAIISSVVRTLTIEVILVLLNTKYYYLFHTTNTNIK